MSSLSPVFLNDYPSDANHLYIYCLEYQRFGNESKYYIVDNGRELDPRTYKIENLSPYSIENCTKNMKMIHPYIYVLGPNTDSKGWQYATHQTKKENSSNKILEVDNDCEEKKSEKYIGINKVFKEENNNSNSNVSSWSNKSTNIPSVRRRLWLATVAFEKDKEFIKNLLIKRIRSSTKIFFSGVVLYHKSSTEFIQKYIVLKADKLNIIDLSDDNVEKARKSISLDNAEIVSLFSDKYSSGRNHVFKIVKKSKRMSLDQRNENLHVEYIFEALNSADKKEWIDRIHYQMMLLSPNLQFHVPGSPTESKDTCYKKINTKLSISWDSDNSSDDNNQTFLRNRTKSNISNVDYIEDELLNALEEARKSTYETKLAIKEVILEFKKRNSITFEMTQKEKKSVKFSNCCIIM